MFRTLRFFRRELTRQPVGGQSRSSRDDGIIFNRRTGRDNRSRHASGTRHGCHHRMPVRNPQKSHAICHHVDRARSRQRHIRTSWQIAKLPMPHRPPSPRIRRRESSTPYPPTSQSRQGCREQSQSTVPSIIGERFLFAAGSHLRQPGPGRLVFHADLRGVRQAASHPPAPAITFPGSAPAHQAAPTISSTSCGACAITGSAPMHNVMFAVAFITTKFVMWWINGRWLLTRAITSHAACVVSFIYASM